MSYGLEIIVGDFGAGKTFFTHSHITGYGSNDTIKIGNYTSPDFHIEFRSIHDLKNILVAIREFKKDPYNLSTKIVIVLDEASLYFNSRDFKEFPKDMLQFMVQLRKLNVHMLLIIQSLKMLDINFRRLCFYVTDYRFCINIVRQKKTFELLSEDANLGDPMNTREVKSKLLWHPAIVVFFRKMFISLYGPLELAFGSAKYDTNELVLTNINVLDTQKLQRLFPCTIQIDNEDQYKGLLTEKRLEFLKGIHARVLKHYEAIMNL